MFNLVPTKNSQKNERITLEKITLLAIHIRMILDAWKSGKRPKNFAPIKLGGEN